MVDLLSSVIYFLPYACPRMFIFFILTSIIVVVIFIYWCSLITLWEIQYNFSTLFSKSTYKRFTNTNNKQSLRVPLFYKIYSLPFTLAKIALYFLLAILSIFTLRLLRLGSVIDFYIAYYKMFYLLIPLKILLSFLLLCYLFWIRTYIITFSQRLHFELKKLYIYLLQVGGLLDVLQYSGGPSADSHRVSYIERWFVKLIIQLYRYKITFYAVYDKNYRYENAYKDLIAEGDFASIFWPLYYFIQYSKYKNSFFVQVLIQILAKINNNFWFFIYVFPLFCLGLTFCYEYYYKHGLLNNIYNVLLLMFMYKIYVDLMYFFMITTVSGVIDKQLCVYYYVMEKMHLKVHKDAARKVLAIFNVSTRARNQEELSVYVENHLNSEKTLPLSLTEEELNARPKTFWQKIVFKISKINFVLLTEIFIRIILEYFYDKYTHNSIRKDLNKFYSFKDSMTKLIYSKKTLILLILSTFYVIWLMPPKISLILLLLLFIFLICTNIIKSKNVMVIIIFWAYYLFMIVLLYILYTKHCNILYMDEVLWASGIETTTMNKITIITQSFTLQEKRVFFEEYLNYLVYATQNDMTSLEKRAFISTIDLNFIHEMITKNTTIWDLKQLVKDFMMLQQKKSLLIKSLVTESALKINQ